MCAVGLAAAAPALAQPTVVIVVRHAEKAAAPADDPPLTEAGAARARALAATLADADVGAVITTQYLRTRETARPLAEARGITPEVVRAGGPVAAHAKAVADAARAHAGKTVLVVGHSNTVTQIVEALGGPRARDLCDSEYSWLFTVVISGPSARVVRSAFGAPSPEVPTGCATPMMPRP
jgi:phosphohistidine phosphatase SixA